MYGSVSESTQVHESPDHKNQHQRAEGGGDDGRACDNLDRAGVLFDPSGDTDADTDQKNQQGNAQQHEAADLQPLGQPLMPGPRFSGIDRRQTTVQTGMISLGDSAKQFFGPLAVLCFHLPKR